MNRSSRAWLGLGASLVVLGIMVPVSAAVVFLGIDLGATEPIKAVVASATAAPTAAQASRLGLPAVALDAYVKAAASPDACPGLTWWIIGGVGAIETNHGRYGGNVADAAGTVHPGIFGPRLDGSLEGTEIISDSDGGRIDGDPAYDRAVGPTQHLPSSWRSNGRDGNGDGIADPQNLYDAARATAVHLCASAGGSMDTPARVRAGIFGYNPSNAYVADVLERAAALSAPVLGDGNATGTLQPVVVRGITVDVSIAPALEAMVAAAAAQGVELTGSGLRTTDEQVALRRAHCGESADDIWRKPSGQCSPPTAIPGTSNHERGLAIDFTNTPGAWAWLAANAGRFGFLNRLPTEPWHWSTTGN